MNEMPTYEEVLIAMKEIVNDENKMKEFRENLWKIDSDNVRNFLGGLFEDLLYDLQSQINK